MEARRPQLADLGVFLLLVAAPLAFTPFSTSPFGDPKLVIVTAAALCLWGAGLPVDRRLARVGAVWVGITALAAVSGTDPIRGLTAQTTGEGGGVVVALAAAVLLVAGCAQADDLRERGRRWFVAACAVVAVFAIAVRLFPDRLGSFGGLSFVGATMGNQLFGAALLAAGIAAALGGRSEARRSRQLLVVGLLSLGVATFGERSALVLPLVALVAVLAKARMPRRRAVALAATVLLVIGAWQVVATWIPTEGRGATVTVASQATDTQRFTVWRVLATRAVPDHPWLGWGPAMSQSAYLANATGDEVVSTSRQWADAHDLLLETLVGTGVFGFLALLVLLVLAGVRALRCPPERAWVFGAAAALGAYALFEPVSLVLTPLLFFFLGAAAGPPRRVVVRSEAIARVGRVAAGVTLGAALIVSLLMMTGATLERWGRAYGEQWAYRAAVRAQPWRLSAIERLAIQRAVDWRSGDQAAGEEARRLIQDAVDAHPWDVDIRVWAADVETLLKNPAGERRWIAAQLAFFPSDRPGLTEEDTAEFP
jgi:O-antigen ligase